MRGGGKPQPYASGSTPTSFVVECSRNSAAVQTARHFVDAGGKHRATGTAALKGTQAYPIAFGMSHALAYDTWFRSTADYSQTVKAMDPMTIKPSDSGDEVDDMSCFRDLDTPGFEWDHRLTCELILPLSRR